MIWFFAGVVFFFFFVGGGEGKKQIVYKMDKKYIILYLALEGNTYVQSYGVALSNKDVPRIIKNEKDKVLACDFMVLELGGDVTKEFIDKNE